MATELGKAYVQIMPSARGISGKIQGAIAGEVQAAGASAGNSLVSAIKGAIIAAGIGTFLSSSIMEGAKLQQSLGGIETLFKNNADKVKAYANEAYKTTGLSANAYMESVTGFSASLLQSLGGDTAKAAEISNMAMIDMADNSNKMGTSMEAIQNAYQGFAKQNYTMLDNLKLGYGGTKEEMQRLLTDAEKLTGVKYDISNLSDVYQAIHAIQENLNITGTTAKESANTFTGSFNAMKASAQNVLGKLSLGEDIKPALHQLVGTTKTFLVNNLWPMFKNIISGLADVIATEFPKVISKLGELLDQGLRKIFGENTTAIDLFKTAIAGVLSAILTFQGVTKVITLFRTFKNGILAVRTAMLALNTALLANPIAAIISAVVAVTAALIYFFTQTETGREIFSKVVEFIKNAWNSLVEFFTTLWNTISTGITTAWNYISEVVMMILTPIIDNIKLIWEGLTTFFTGLWEGIKLIFTTVLQIIVDFIITKFTTMSDTVTTIVGSVKDFITGAWDTLKTSVTTIVDGLVNFLQTAWEGLKNTVITIVNNLVEGANEAWETLKENVSSAVKSVGEFFDELWNIDLFAAGAAIIQGFLDGLKSMWESAKNFVSGIANWIRENKGPISYDRKLLIPAGKAIMTGLNQGLSDDFKKVKSTVSSMAGEINSGFSDSDLEMNVSRELSSELSLNRMTYSNFNTNDNQIALITQIGKLEGLLQKILDKDVNTYLDGDELAKNSYAKHFRIMKREGI